MYDAFGQLAAEYNTFASSFACTTCYVTTDGLGSVRMVTDQNGNAVTRHDYLPFGEEIAGTSPSSDVEQRFTGQIRDTETGMDFFNARYYTAALGQFNSADPANAGADSSDPQTWNGYGYVRGNPLALVDPSGQFEEMPGTVVTGDPGAMGTVASTGSKKSSGLSMKISFFKPVSSSPSFNLRNVFFPPRNGTKSCASNKGGSIWTGTVTFQLTSAGAFLGSLPGPEGTLPGALFGSTFGFGATASYVQSTHSIDVGVTIQAGLAINGGSGGNINVVNVPAGQNPNSIANGQSYSVTYQPQPYAGSTVTKSLGSGGPVVGPSVGSKVPVSGSASYNICLWNCGCGG